MLPKKIPDHCAESYLLIKSEVQNGASVSIMQDLEAEGFIT